MTAKSDQSNAINMA